MEKEIVYFDNEDLKLAVNLMEDTVWLSLEQMAELFDRDKSVISRHIKNVLVEELDAASTVANFATVQKEGNREITRNIDYYNLDMIISVGYRVKSKNGIIFRKWATKVLKEYMIKGVAINEERLKSLENTVKLIEIANRGEERISDSDAKDILKVIGSYTKSLDLLDDYDHRKVTKIKGTVDDRIIKYDDCLNIIKKLKFAESSDIFGVERMHGLESIINDIYLTFGGNDVYKSVEEKACNFLYMLIKNHPFVDGNKRIAATLFIFFLNYYGILYKNDRQVIDNNTLTAMTLLIAESNPKEKEIIIDLVMNFLK